jgi:hypothetical protein
MHLQTWEFIHRARSSANNLCEARDYSEYRYTSDKTNYFRFTVLVGTQSALTFQLTHQVLRNFFSEFFAKIQLCCFIRPLKKGSSEKIFPQNQKCFFRWGRIWPFRTHRGYQCCQGAEISAAKLKKGWKKFGGAGKVRGRTFTWFIEKGLNFFLGLVFHKDHLYFLPKTRPINWFTYFFLIFWLI